VAVVVVVAGLACGPSTNVERDSFLSATVTTVNMGSLDRQRIDLTRLGMSLNIKIMKHDDGKKTYQARFVFRSSTAVSIPDECNPTYMVKPAGGQAVTLTCVNPDPGRDPKRTQDMPEPRECALSPKQVQWFASAKTMIRSTCADEKPIDYKISPEAAAELSAALSGRKRR